MRVSVDIFLCQYEHAGEPHRLWAALDELTLTYRVVERAGDGEVRELRCHVPSLSEARRWAIAYGDQRLHALATAERPCTR